MQRIEFVKNGELDNIHKLLTSGYTIKSVHPVTQTVATSNSASKGDVFAYIVLEK